VAAERGDAITFRVVVEVLKAEMRRHLGRSRTWRSAIEVVKRLTARDHGVKL